MENKPLKRSAEIKPLSQEHHFSLLFVWKIRQGLAKEIALERILKYVSYFWSSHLSQHFLREEKALFCLFPDHWLVRDALKEHEIMRHLFAQLENDEESAEQQIEYLKQLSDLIEQHTRMEERSLFPDLEKQMSPEQLSSVADVLHHLHPERLMDVGYEDEFWVK